MTGVQTCAFRSDLNTLLDKISTLKFYDGIIFSQKNNATLMAVTFNDATLNTKDRLSVTDSIRGKGEDFSKATAVEAHYSGLPFIRTTVARKISKEMSFFLGVAFLVTAILLFIFFRSIQPVLFSLLVIVCSALIFDTPFPISPWYLFKIKMQFGTPITIIKGGINPDKTVSL